LSVLPKARASEKAAVLLYVVANLTVPFVFLEFYPFTTVPLFTGAPRYYCRYEIETWAGVRHPPRHFALHRTDLGDKRGWPTGLRKHWGFNRFGVVPSERELAQHLRSALPQFPWMRGVTVTQHVYGADGNGVGKVKTVTVRVENPHYAEEP